MRRGHRLEAQLKKVLDCVNSMGYHAHKNHPNRTQDGVYLEGEPFDYEIFLPTTFDCFDAKEVSSGDRWDLKNKDIKQAEHLFHAKSVGMRAYFLVQFGAGTQPLMIDVDIVVERLKSGKMSVKKGEGKPWDIPRLLKE